jgi:CheY-like chemotaxis protein
MLEDLGCVATEVRSAEAALQLLRREAGIDVAITDHAMTGMTGPGLATHIKRRGPATSVVIATGNAELLGEGERNLPRLSKPYRQSDLAAMAASLVADPPAARHAAAG